MKKDWVEFRSERPDPATYRVAEHEAAAQPISSAA